MHWSLTVSMFVMTKFATVIEVPAVGQYRWHLDCPCVCVCVCVRVAMCVCARAAHSQKMQRSTKKEVIQECAACEHRWTSLLR